MESRVTLGVVLIAVAIGTTLTGCGSKKNTSNTIVAPRPLPLISALEFDPEGRVLLLSTNRGLHRIAAGRATRITTTLKSGGLEEVPIGQQLLVYPDLPGVLLGSGHPNETTEGGLPPYLGLLRSTDQGRTWAPASGYGVYDFHTLHRSRGVLVGADGTRGMLASSTDGGSSFSEQRLPERSSVDMAVDPGDPRHVVISTSDSLYATPDAGRTWSRLGPARNARLEWPAPRSLLRADDRGSIERSADGGRRWATVGRTAPQPQQLATAGPARLYTAYADGSIRASVNGGRTWRRVFTASP